MRSDTNFHKTISLSDNLSALILTCQIHAESVPVLYSANHWMVEHAHTDAFYRWLQTPDYLQHTFITRIDIRIEDLRHTVPHTMDAVAAHYCEIYCLHMARWDLSRTQLNILVRDLSMRLDDPHAPAEVAAACGRRKFRARSLNSVPEEVELYISKGEELYKLVDAVVAESLQTWASKQDRRIMCDFFQELARLIDPEDPSKVCD